MQLKRSSKNGLYLRKFNNRLEAKKYIESLFNRYRYTPNQKNMTVRKLCRIAEEDGVYIQPKTLSKWMKEDGIELRKVNPRPSYKTRGTYTVTKEVAKVLDERNYPNKSYLVDFGLRLVLGLPCKDLIMFLPTDDEPITVIFKEMNNGKYRAIISGDVTMRDKQQLRVLLKKADDNGIQEVKKYCKELDYTYYGGTELLKSESAETI